MPSARDDYLMRLIRQIAEVLRTLRGRLDGGDSAAELLPEIRAAEDELLGGRAAMLRMLDPRTAAQIMGGSDAVRVWAGLLRLEADALRRDGQAGAASAVAARAAALERLVPPAAEPDRAPPRR